MDHNPQSLESALKETLKKSSWQSAGSRHYKFFCPMCKVERKLPFKPQPGARHYAQVAITAVMFTLVTWPLFEWKGIVSFVPFWVIFESFYRIRVRAKVRCNDCGFDPFLHLVDVKKARAEVEEHWRKKFEEKGIPFPEKGKITPKPLDTHSVKENPDLTEQVPESNS